MELLRSAAAHAQLRLLISSTENKSFLFLVRFSLPEALLSFA